MWELKTQTASERVYLNTLTGTESRTKLIHTDIYGQKWWSFTDLFSIPLMREIAAKKVIELSSAGLTPEDLRNFISVQKTILRAATDPERYEKAYAQVMNLESMVNAVSDPVKQTLGLATVYILADDERPDIFQQEMAFKKMDTWQTDANAMGFFLNWLTDTIANYVSASSTIGQIASALQQSAHQRLSE